MFVSSGPLTICSQYLTLACMKALVAASNSIDTFAAQVEASLLTCLQVWMRRFG